MAKDRPNEGNSVNDAVLDRIIRHAIFLERFKNREARDYVRFLNENLFPDLLARVRRDMERLKSRGSNVTPRSSKRLAELFRWTQRVITEENRKATNVFLKRMQGFSVQEAEWMTGVMNGAIPASIGVALSEPNPAILRKLVTSDPMQGRFVRDWFNSMNKSTQDRVRQQVMVGVAQGEDPDQIVRRLSGTSRNFNRDGALNVTRHQATSNVRTTINHISNKSREETFKQNNDLIDAVQYVAVLDNRTTLICASLDGKVFPVDSGPRPPQHFNCRSTVVPVLKSWEELGLDASEVPAPTRASMNGQVPAETTFGEWLKKQPVDIQEDVLGKSKAKLFRSGRFKLEQFVGPAGRPLTLEQLRRLDRP